MIYSSSARVRGQIEEAQPGRPSRALLTIAGRRLPLPPRGATIGRSRDCDIVLDDTGISRRHAEIRPSGEGWTVTDLGSTNGLQLNGRTVRGAHPLQAGDRVELGSTEIVFELG
jgi:pSer/pThr/pTyr-binding forkhead associated (FHA) protein